MAQNYWQTAEQRLDVQTLSALRQIESMFDGLWSFYAPSASTWTGVERFGVGPRAGRNSSTPMPRVSHW